MEISKWNDIILYSNIKQIEFQMEKSNQTARYAFHIWKMG